MSFDEEPDGDPHGECAAEIERLHAELAALRADAERCRWFAAHASVGFDGAPSWDAVARLPVFDSADQSLVALVDTAMAAHKEQSA